VDGVDDLRRVNALQISARNPEMRMPKLALNNRQWDPLTSHLYSVSMAELVWRKPAAHTGHHGESTQFRTSTRL
jgi:hypothetical protein